jgi:hypothetical protein
LKGKRILREIGGARTAMALARLGADRLINGASGDQRANQRLETVLVNVPKMRADATRCAEK